MIEQISNFLIKYPFIHYLYPLLIIWLVRKADNSYQKYLDKKYREGMLKK